MIKNIYPSLDEFKKLAKKGNIIPVFKEILADLETPVSTYLKLAAKEKYAYLLESVEGGERWGRYSFIAWEPKYIFQSKGNKFSLTKPGQRPEWTETIDPLISLKEIMERFNPVEAPGLPRFWGGAVGYVSYDMARFFENLPNKPKDKLELPESLFLITEKMVIFDHLSHTVKIVVCVDIEDGKSISASFKRAEKDIAEIEDKLKKPLKLQKPPKFSHQKLSSNMKKEEFCSKVEKAKHYIKIGDIIQVVPSQRFSRKTNAKAFDIYRALRLINPSPYMYFIRCEDFELVGSSPEILVRKEDQLAQLRPIAGTRPRGGSEEEERKLQKELLEDPKELAEHIMLVDLEETTSAGFAKSARLMCRTLW